MPKLIKKWEKIEKNKILLLFEEHLHECDVAKKISRNRNRTRTADHTRGPAPKMRKRTLSPSVVSLPAAYLSPTERCNGSLHSDNSRKNFKREKKYSGRKRTFIFNLSEVRVEGNKTKTKVIFVMRDKQKSLLSMLFKKILKRQFVVWIRNCFLGLENFI